MKMTKIINQESVAGTRRIGSTAACCLIFLTGLVIASQADAAGFGVRVVDEFGKPLSGASVCVGTQGKTDQFGSYMTSADGDIMIDDLPQVPLSVVVSKKSYQGVQFFEPVRNWNLITEVTLLMNGEGPTCSDADMVLTEDDKRSLTIGRLQVSGNAGAYTIDSEISGDPSHYRVSTRRDFKDAKWRPYRKQVKFWGKTDGALYFQVRRYSGKSNGWLEARSQVADIAVN